MAPGASALALLDPRVFADEDEINPEAQDDPRRKLIKLSALQELGGLAGGGGSANDNLETPQDSEDESGPRSAPATASPATATSTIPAAASALQRAATVAPMPATTPASGAMSAAAARLERAQRPFQSQGLGRDLVRGLLQAAPAAIGGGKAAGGAVEGANIAYQRNLTERGQAAQQYEFEAGRQERERDQAIKERLAEATIQSQAAYRTLMAGLAARRADTGQQNADTRAGSAAAQEADKGWIATKSPSGVMSLQPIPQDKLSAVRQAQVGVEQATADLDRAKKVAIPQQIDIMNRRLGIQQQMLQKSLASLELQKQNVARENAQFEVNYGITPSGEPSDMPSRVPGAMTDQGGTAVPLKVASQMGPSGFEKSRGGAATNVQQTAKETADLIRANKNVLGPIWGRLSLADLAAGQMPDFVQDPKQRQALEQIITSMQSTYSFASTAHGWRSSEAPAKFEQAIGGITRDPEMTATGLETLAHNMSGVVKQGSTARGTGATDAASHLRKAAPSSPNNNSPAAPKVRKWTEFVNK